MTANVQTMFSGRSVVPWHKRGKVLEGSLSSAEAIAAAGLDWTVSKRQIAVLREDGTWKTDDEFFAVSRDDNDETLGIVGQQQALLQNANAFRLMDQLVGEKHARYLTAGALGKGERVWLLMQMPGYLRAGKDDVAEKYVLLCHGHDGSLAFNLFETTVWVVCQNTMNAALSQKKGGVKVKHTRGALGALTVEMLRERLGYADRWYNEQQEAAQFLASKKIGAAEFTNRYLQAVWPLKDGESYGTRTRNMLDEIEQLFDGSQMGAQLAERRGTWWGAYNAISEYMDHHKGARETRNNSESQNLTASILFGSAKQVKQKALSAALELAGA
jgi:phage/plasmid-like protein (TIGR03299 family)